MPTIDEAVDSYVNAIKVMDLGTLMAALTPEAMGKAMSMGGGAPPTGITDISGVKKRDHTRSSGNSIVVSTP